MLRELLLRGLQELSWLSHTMNKMKDFLSPLDAMLYLRSVLRDYMAGTLGSQQCLLEVRLSPRYR